MRDEEKNLTPLMLSLHLTFIIAFVALLATCGIIKLLIWLF